MKLLVIGSNGQLGSELKRICLDPGLRRDDKGRSRDDIFVFVDREELDITDADAVQKFFNEHNPDYCINAAAYTNVEKAEDEQSLAHAVNALGAENIARACAKNNTILLHISTDFVFDGKKSAPYTEDDEPHPLGAYARSKYEGELAVQEACPKSFIVRTSWLYSSYGSNFVKTILRLCKERDSLPVVADQYGSPTYARDLARALLQMIEKMGSGTWKTVSGTFSQAKTNQTPFSPQSQTPVPFGTYHYADDGEVTWFEFAQKIRDLAGLTCELHPIPSSEYASKVTRPAYSVLSSKKIQQTLGLFIPEWDESVTACLALLRT
ncbi:dTDP-4-dehydrorhamnose reductase [Candidatus Uhrbacteria bacterium]|nr:dTDP-4-dehydrorhamnose reductase [Candidatus Uhrbacteria bacterium]